MNTDTVELLKECDAGISMGVSSIDDVLSKVENRELMKILMNSKEEHEDLKNNLLEGKNYLTGTTDVTDNNGHGTHVSGIIAAEMNEIGVVGVAPKAKIVPLKCFDPTHSTSVEDILAPIYDAVDVYDCDVINMSIGFTGYSTKLARAITYATNNGVIVVIH